jgi:bifunctional DNA-binding transcriptional regulator/antitoxin component of YhaV-PrlF toxin-antitoxin module
MNTTVLSDEGKVTLPESVLSSHFWKPGLEFLIIEAEGGILLKPKATAFEETHFDEVAGCLRYTGKPKSIEDMDAAIKQAIQEAWRDRG